MRIIVLALLAAAVLSGCAGARSKVFEPSESQGGLVYFMPKKDIVVAITVSGGKVTAIEVDESSAYPDLTQRFVMAPGRNSLGKVTMDAVVGANGLLDSTSAKYDAQVSDALESIAGTAGRALVSTTRTGAGTPGPCSSDGNYRFVYEAGPRPGSKPGQAGPCGLKLSIERRFEANSLAALNPRRPTTDLRAGIYYRQALPYIVTVSGELTTNGSSTALLNKIDHQAIVFSPSESPVQFAPIIRTFFATNDATLDFDEGMLTQNKQVIDGELVGLFKIPASVFDAYFSAIGSTFEMFKKNTDFEKQAIDAQRQLEFARIKYEACLVAARHEDDGAIASLGCNQ